MTEAAKSEHRALSGLTERMVYRRPIFYQAPEGVTHI
jgi:hypothetical protein